MKIDLSVIIAVKNDMRLGFLPKLIDFYSKFPNVELLWVVGPSKDGTKEFLEAKNQKIIESDSNSRGARQNVGIRVAASDFILLNHPRSLLEESALPSLLKTFMSSPLSWGGFTHKFIGNNHALLKFTSYYSNEIRFDRSGIVYLDHCIFFNRSLFGSDSEYVPDVDIFEDTLLSEKLRESSPPLRLSNISYTSPVRFEKNGVWRQAIMNQVLKMGHSLSIPHKLMNKIYEKGLGLNSNYS